MVVFLMFVAIHLVAYGIAITLTKQKRKDTFFALIVIQLCLIAVINFAELITKFPIFTQPSLALFFVTVAYYFWQNETRWYETKMWQIKHFPFFYVAAIFACGYLAAMLNNFYTEVLH